MTANVIYQYQALKSSNGDKFLYIFHSILLSSCIGMRRNDKMPRAAIK